MKNVLVIGGSYFVGRVFVEALAPNPEYRIVLVNRGNRTLGFHYTSFTAGMQRTYAWYRQTKTQSA